MNFPLMNLLDFRRSLWVVFLLGLAVNSHMASAQSPEHWKFANLLDCLSIRDGKTRERVAWETLIERLADADVVFLGETHDDDATHEFQLAVYRALLDRCDDRVVLAMEMFERDVQPHLDAYLAGEIDEATFLGKSRPWGNYREGYRPLVELAKERKKPVVASNFPRTLRMKLMQAGDKGLDALGDDRQLAPAELFPNTDLYWKRTDNATRGHSAFMPAANSSAERLLSTQSLWDNSMGEACVQALAKYPGHQVVHVNGGFHSEYWDGTAGQVRQRLPNAKILTIAIRPTSNPQAAELRGAPVADFVAYVENRAKNLRDGHHHVVVGSEQPFLLDVPAWATDSRPAPLLIWLADDGLGTKDNLAWWQANLGSEAAIAILEPTHRQRERDLTISGRWFWSDRFPEDTATTIQAVERLWQYSLSRFPIDPQRVVIAGEGTGGTMVAASALLTGRIEGKFVAWEPRQYAKLKDFPLPLLENWGSESPPHRQLSVTAGPEHEKWWADELQAYRSVGIDCAWRQIESDPWQRAAALPRQIKAAMGLPQRTFSPAERKYFVAASGTPLEHHWLRMLAMAKSTGNTAIAVVDPQTAAALPASDRVEHWGLSTAELAERIPLCPGPFGGTTVLVVDAGEGGEGLETWLRVEQEDPLTKRSRFHRLRIATVEGERSLANVLEKLLAENRKNVLIVPAQFYAADDFMRDLERAAAPFSDSMTLQWLPGLGGSR